MSSLEECLVLKNVFVKRLLRWQSMSIFRGQMSSSTDRIFSLGLF